MRFKSFFVLLAALIAISLLSYLSFAQKEEVKTDDTVTCPVTGKILKKSEVGATYKYKDTEYHFCCNGCLTKFKADPENYINAAHDMICGMKVDKDKAQKVLYEGKEYYFCSDHCKTAFEKDPKAYIDKMKKCCQGKESKEGCQHKASSCTNKK